MEQNKWKIRKGTGIKVKVPGDIDKDTGKQKYRPGIVIKSYPSHVKVQLLSTQSNKNDWYKIDISNKTGYVRSIYNITISFDLIQSLWFERGKLVYINSNSVFFKKIAEMEYKEILGNEYQIKLDCKLKIKLLIEWISDLQKENIKLKKQLQKK